MALGVDGDDLTFTLVLVVGGAFLQSTIGWSPPPRGTTLAAPPDVAQGWRPRRRGIAIAAAAAAALTAVVVLHGSLPVILLMVPLGWLVTAARVWWWERQHGAELWSEPGRFGKPTRWYARPRAAAAPAPSDPA